MKIFSTAPRLRHWTVGKTQCARTRNAVIGRHVICLCRRNSLPNCLAVLSAGDGLGRNRFGILLFPLSRRARRCHIVLGSNGSLVRNAPSFCSVCKVLSCPSSVLLKDDIVEGLDCSCFTWCKACVVICADGHTATGDTEITMKCVFYQELTSMLSEGSTHSCKWASCDLSTPMPLSTANNNCPKTVFGKFCIVNCSCGKAAIFGTAASTVLTCGPDGALVSDPTLPYPTCESRMCSIGDVLLNGSLFGPDCASRTMCKSGAVTCAKGTEQRTKPVAL